MSHATLMNEDFPARIEAVFPDRASATTAAHDLCHRFEFCEEQFRIVAPGELPPRTHRNRYALGASGRHLQRRQIAATFIAFAIIIVGLGLLHIIGADTLPKGLTYAIMGALIVIAVGITVSGLIAWRPVRMDTKHKAMAGEAVLIINVHDVSEQYPLREALVGMGARVEGPVSASVS